MHNLANLTKHTTLRRFFSALLCVCVCGGGFPAFVHYNFSLSIRFAFGVCACVCILVVHQISQYVNLTEDSWYIISRVYYFCLEEYNYHKLCFPAHCRSITFEHTDNLKSQL